MPELSYLKWVSQFYSGSFAGLLCISCLTEVGLHTQVESVILCEEAGLSRKCLWNSINQNIPNTMKAEMCHLGGLRNGAKNRRSD